jgi:hypothetical protein
LRYNDLTAAYALHPDDISAAPQRPTIGMVVLTCTPSSAQATACGATFDRSS